MSPAVVRLLKVSGYLLVSMLLALLASPEFRDFIKEYPEMIAYVPLVNVVLAFVLKLLEGFLPEGSKIREVI